MGLPADVQALLEAHAPHFSATPEGKIKCELNGHTFPAQAQALKAFVNGKKYAKLKAAAELEQGLEKYEPFIVKSKNMPNTLFCALTGELLNARLAEVKLHLRGKKFARAQARFQADEQELLEEPSMGEGSDMEEDGPEGSDGPGVWLPEEVLREYEMVEAADGEEGDAAAAGDGGAAGGDAANGAGQGEEDEAAAAAPKGKARGGKVKQQQQQQQAGEQKAGKPARQPRGSKAAAEGGKAKGGKQQQQQQAAGGSGGAGKAKAPRAKKARTG